jgi:hypothetical protein
MSEPSKFPEDRPLPRRVMQAGMTGLVVALLVLLPWWRHRVWVHRPPFAVHYALNDFIAYTSDYALLALLAVGWTRLAMRRKRPLGGGRRLRAGPWFVTGPLVAMLVLTAVSAAWAVDPAYAGYQAVRQLLLLGFFVLVVNLPVQRRWFVAGLALSVGVQAVVGLLQVRRGASLGLARLGELRLNPLWPGISVVMRGEGRWLRAYGLTQHPNLLGGVLAGLLLMLVGAYAAGVGSRRRGAALLLVPYGLGLGALLMTFSRGAWLGAAVGGTVCLAAAWRSGRRGARVWVPPAVLTAAIGVAFAVTQWPLLEPRLGLTYQGAEVRSVDERSTLIAGARALRALRPVLGVGAGGFSTALYRLAPDAIAAYPVYQPVHNVPLLLAAEVGLLGAGLWAALLLGPVAAAWIRPAAAEAGWLAGLTGALAALFTIGWYEAYPWRSQQGALLLWLVLGLWARAWAARCQIRVESC